MNLSRFTARARPRDIAQVVGTMNAAKTVKVPSEPTKSSFVSMYT
ncbi:hypothetical protein SALBM311S_07029 [Streptomyces alboniger]